MALMRRAAAPPDSTKPTLRAADQKHSRCFQEEKQDYLKTNIKNMMTSREEEEIISYKLIKKPSSHILNNTSVPAESSEL